MKAAWQIVRFFLLILLLVVGVGAHIAVAATLGVLAWFAFLDAQYLASGVLVIACFAMTTVFVNKLIDLA